MYKIFYCRCASSGRKIDMSKINPRICFEMATDHQLIKDADQACRRIMAYASVVGITVLKLDVEEISGKVNG